VTGIDVKAVREALDLDAYVFGKVLGVHMSTVFRWESHTKSWSGNPLHQTILEALKRWCKTAGADERGLLGARLRGYAHNTLGGLRTLLNALK